MLTPEELATIAETMQPHLDELNMWISQDMIRRFMARMGRGEKDLLSGTDQWQAQVYKEAGGLYEDLQKELHEFTGKSEDEIKAIFEDAGIRAWNADDIFYVAQGFESVPLLSSERMLNILTDCYQRTNNEVYNFTRTTANETQRRFIKLLDSTHMKVMSGAQSYTAAVKEAVSELANTQTEVIYPSGHKDTIETAVLRAVRTGVAQASGNMTLQGMEERDWDLIRVSAHLGARYGDGGENPGNHYWWQGKLYSRTGRDKRYPDFISSTGYGSGEGLCGWNCRHSYGPGEPDHNPYKEYDAEENKKAYDLSQKQRKIERTIRADKLKVKGLREAIDCAEDKTLKKELSEDYEKASARLSMHNAEYSHFCKSNGLKRYDDRLSIAKWNRSEAMKAVRAAQRLEKKKKSAIIDAEKIRKDILNNKYNLNLNIGNQNKHIKGSHSYNEENHKSILFGDLNYAQGLVQKYHGTGDIKMTEDGAWTKKEFVEANFDVGLSYNRDKQQMQPTNRFAIHYGKRGTHIVPVERKE
nr:MAG TPA: minor capsid protein [Caudoviricetes sp.]